MKICQIPHVIFQTRSQFLGTFYITLQCHERYLLFTFLAQTLYTLVKGGPLNSKFLWFLSAPSKKILNSSCQFWKNNSSSNFASFFSVITHSSSVIYQLMHFHGWTKWSHQSPNFVTSKCSGDHLSNSSCHSPNHKSVFLQILHDSSVSWTITSLYFFRSNVIYFAQKGSIKVLIF